jgi:hypothetical protein
MRRPLIYMHVITSTVNHHCCNVIFLVLCGILPVVFTLLALKRVCRVRSALLIITATLTDNILVYEHLCKTDAACSSGEQQQQLLHSTFSLVLIVRFLERGALLQLGELVHPGGYLLHCTFQLEADSSWPHHSPKRLDKVSSSS